MLCRGMGGWVRCLNFVSPFIFVFLYFAAQMQDDFISSGKRNHNVLSENPSANKRRPRSRHNDV